MSKRQRVTREEVEQAEGAYLAELRAAIKDWEEATAQRADVYANLAKIKVLQLEMPRILAEKLRKAYDDQERAEAAQRERRHTVNTFILSIVIGAATIGSFLTTWSNYRLQKWLADHPAKLCGP